MQQVEQAIHDPDTRDMLSRHPKLSELRTLIDNELDTPVDPKTGLLWARQYFQSEHFKGWLHFTQGDLLEELHKDEARTPEVTANDELPPDEEPMFVAIFIDGDRWKEINYQYGHEGGDEAIISLGQELQRIFRSDDQVLRFGGDEFVVLMKNIPNSTVTEMAGILTERLSRLGLSIQNNEVPGSATLGLAALPMRQACQDEGWQDQVMGTISQAERDLVRAKKAR